jgi:hypothetical protein
VHNLCTFSIVLFNFWTLQAADAICLTDARSKGLQLSGHRYIHVNVNVNMPQSQLLSFFLRVVRHAGDYS